MDIPEYSFSFRNDVSMQNADAPRMVLFDLCQRPLHSRSCPPIRISDTCLYRQSQPKSNDVTGETCTKLRIDCDQLVDLELPVPIPTFGSDAKQCNIIRHAR